MTHKYHAMSWTPIGQLATCCHHVEVCLGGSLPRQNENVSVCPQVMKSGAALELSVLPPP